MNRDGIKGSFWRRRRTRMKMVVMIVMTVALTAVFGCQTGPRGETTPEGGQFTVAAVPGDTNRIAGSPGSESRRAELLH